jgi:hypothetical protein
VVLAANGCGVDTPDIAPDPGGGGGGSETGNNPIDPAPAPEPTTFTETQLTVMLRLTPPPAATPDGPTTLDITARDGITPVITDLWLYSIDETGAQLPLTGFTVPSATGTPVATNRKTGRLMLPATIKGAPSGFPLADDGRQNGILTNAQRGRLSQGAMVPMVTGTVTVTLPVAPTLPLLVVAAVEDQRYAGAAVILPSGDPGVVPSGIGVPETHTRRSYARDVAPIVKVHCGVCHKPTHTYLSRPGGTRDELINDNFGLALQTRTCQQKNPDGGVKMDQCVRDITAASFLVEPGVPALSNWLVRARPDEEGNASANGIAWWGFGGTRYGSLGDKRMPSTTESTSMDTWNNAPTDFDEDPASYLVVWEWVAQGAAP